MIVASRFSGLSFKQSGNSCILASYAIAAYPFTGTPVLDYFRDYRDVFFSDKAQNMDPEPFYNAHFHPLYQYISGKSGFQLLRDCHERIDRPSFNKARSIIRLSLIDSVEDDLHEIESDLKGKTESLLIVFVKQPSLKDLMPYHAIVIGYDTNGFFDYDVNSGCVSRRISSLNLIGKLGDGIVVSRLP